MLWLSLREYWACCWSMSMIVGNSVVLQIIVIVVISRAIADWMTNRTRLPRRRHTR